MENENASVRGFSPSAQLFTILLYCFTGFVSMYAIANWSFKYLFGISLFEDFMVLQNSTENWVLQANRTFILYQHLLVFIIPSLIFFWLYKKRTHEKVLLCVKSSWKQYAVIAPIFIGGTALITLSAYFNASLPLPDFLVSQDEGIQEMTMKLIHTGEMGTFIINACLIAVIPAIGEELLFRGIIQNLTIQWTQKTWLGIIIAAFFFSALHMQFTGFLPRFLIGVVLGWLYVGSQNILIPMIYHFLHNFTSLTMERFANDSSVSETINSEVLSGGEIVTLLIFCLFLVLGYFLQEKWVVVKK